MKRLAICAVAAAVIAILVIPQIRKARETGARQDVKNDLKQIMLALHNYHDQHRCFPPAFVVGPDGQRWHSWRALILHHLDPQLAAIYRFDEPWNGPHNSQLSKLAPAVLQSDRYRPSAAATSYFAVVGKRTMWPAFQSLRMLDISDGTSNTLALVEDGRSDISWLEPRDMLPGEVFRSFANQALADNDSVRMAAFADGAVRVLHNHIDRPLLASLLTPKSFTESFTGDDWPQDLEEAAPTQQFKPTRDVDSIDQTDVVAVLTQPLDPTRNQIWCVSMAISWKGMNSHAIDRVSLVSQNSLAEELSACPIGAEAVSADAMFAGFTNGQPESDSLMLKQLRQKFPDLDTELQTFSKPDAGWAIRIVTAIRKQMPFKSLFHRFETPLIFESQGTRIQVNSFGHEPGRDGDEILTDQVVVVDDRGDDDFILRLNTIGPQKDQIILAMIPAEESLEATWNAVRDRTLNPNPGHDRFTINGHETLQIPVMDFSISKRFQELEGPVNGFGDVAAIDFVYQNIRLRLDESGADFISVAEVGVVGEFGSDDYNPARIRQFIFNRPFLVALKEPQTEDPYFVSWIANSELMETFSE